MPLLIGYMAERAVHRDRWVGPLLASPSPVPLRMVNGPEDLPPIDGRYPSGIALRPAGHEASGVRGRPVPAQPAEGRSRPAPPGSKLLMWFTWSGRQTLLNQS